MCYSGDLRGTILAIELDDQFTATKVLDAALEKEMSETSTPSDDGGDE